MYACILSVIIFCKLLSVIIKIIKLFNNIYVITFPRVKSHEKVVIRTVRTKRIGAQCRFVKILRANAGLKRALVDLLTEMMLFYQSLTDWPAQVSKIQSKRQAVDTRSVRLYVPNITEFH